MQNFLNLWNPKNIISMEVPKSTLYTYSNDYWKSNTFFLAEWGQNHLTGSWKRLKQLVNNKNQ